MATEHEVDGIRVRFADADALKDAIETRLSYVIPEGETRPSTVAALVRFQNKDGSAREEAHVFLIDDDGAYVELPRSPAAGWRPEPTVIGYWIVDTDAGRRVVRVVSAGASGFAVFESETASPQPLEIFGGKRWWGPITGFTE